MRDLVTTMRSTFIRSTFLPAVTVVALAGCGAPGDDFVLPESGPPPTTAAKKPSKQQPKDAVAEVIAAAEATLKSGSLTYELDAVGPSGVSFSIDLEGASGSNSGSQEYSSKGVWDLERDLGTQEASNPVTGSAKLVYDGATTYINMESLSAQTGKPWTKVAMQGTEVLASDLSGVVAADSLQLLRGAVSASKAGRAQVEGVSTTRYKAVVEVERVLDEADGDRLASLLESSSQKVTEADAEVWVDDKSMIRRLRLATREANDYAQTYTFSRFGSDVEVEVPPESEVSDPANTAGLNP
jgi:hypothetical protein